MELQDQKHSGIMNVYAVLFCINSQIKPLIQSDRIPVWDVEL